MLFKDINNDGTRDLYYEIESSLYDALREKGYKLGRVNKEISQTEIDFSVNTIEEDFAKAFSHLVPYDELLSLIRVKKAVHAERKRLWEEESWRFF